MAIDYTDWPTAQQILDHITTMRISLQASVTVSSDMLLLRRQAAIDNITKRTHREFKPGVAGEIRYFDGSGTQVQLVDNYIDISAIRVDVNDVQGGYDLTGFFKPETKTFPKTRIYFLQGSRPVLRNRWLDRFPEGYRNIKVTGQWGYGTAIPADVWQAVLYYAVGELITMNAASQLGLLVSWSDGDVRERYSGVTPKEALDLLKYYDDIVDLYMAPSAPRLGRNRVKIL